MLQQKEPKDLVIATGERRAVRCFSVKPFAVTLLDLAR